MTIGGRRTTKAALLVVLMVVLATLVSYPASGTDEGTLTIATDTTLTKDHHGNIVIAADGIALDCAGFNVVGSGAGNGISVSSRAGVTVENCNVSGFATGLYLFTSTGSILSGNAATSNTEDGFAIFGSSSFNTFANNSATDNARNGFSVAFSFNNTLTNNTVWNNLRDGFSIGPSVFGNILQNNTVVGNGRNGFVLWEFDEAGAVNNTLANNTAIGNGLFGFTVSGSFSSGNRIFHNNIVNNSIQARDVGGVNFWDNGYPTGTELDLTTGGNYWSDYTGVDNCKGVNQDECTGPDGIGDTPYVIDLDSQDRYPFMASLLGDFPPVAPVAAFAVTPGAGNTTTIFAVDASDSSDSDGADVALEVRWDWEDDGVWDTLRSTTKTAEHQYTSPGNYTIRLEVIDLSGLVDEAALVVAVSSSGDTVPPVTHAVGSGTIGEAGWWMSPVLVELAATDDATGVANTFYRIDFGLWETYSVPFTIGDGVRTVEYYSVDSSGNTEAVKHFEALIDTVAPVTALAVNRTVLPAVVTLTASDTTSGVASVAYRIDGGVWQDYIAPFTVDVGTYLVEYNATDIAGNAETMKTARVTVDGPTLIITTDTTLTADFAGHIVIGADNIILDCAGYNVTGAGVGYGIFLNERTGVTVKNCQVEKFATGFFLEGSSDNTVTGNTARNNTAGFRLFPTLVGGAFHRFSSDNVLENNTAIDNAAGFHLRYASGNLLQNNTATNPGGDDFARNAGEGFTASYDEGNRFVDNTASGNSVGFILRSSSGSTLIGNSAINNTRHGFILAAANNVLMGNTAERNSYIGFEVSGSSNNTLVGNTASDNGVFSLGAGFALDFSNPSNPVFSSDNTLERNAATGNVLGFAFRASDSNTLVNNEVRNNTVGFHLTHFTFCTGNPVVCVLRSSDNNTIYRNNIVNNTVQIEELSLDNIIAVNDWHHPVLEEGNFWSDYDGTDDGSGTGKHAIAGDGIGDTLIPHPGPGYDSFPLVNEFVSEPDTTSPSVSVISPADGSTLASTSVRVSGTAQDDVAVEKVELSTDAASWVLTTGTTSWSGNLTLVEGQNTIFARATDTAGNTKTANITVIVDTVAPETSLTLDGTLGENGWYTTPVTVTLTASDATSGVISVVYRVNGGAWQDYRSPFTVEGDGVQTVEYYSADVAGNEEVVTSSGVGIDTTSPSMSISSPAAGASLPTADIEVTWEAADATSGIDRIEVSLDDGAPLVLTATTTSYTFTGVSDGTHNVTATAFDVAGNSFVLSVDFTVDTDIPTEPSGSGPLLGISVGMIAVAAAGVALLLWRWRAGGKTQG